MTKKTFKEVVEMVVADSENNVGYFDSTAKMLAAGWTHQELAEAIDNRGGPNKVFFRPTEPNWFG